MIAFNIETAEYISVTLLSIITESALALELLELLIRNRSNASRVRKLYITYISV